MKVRMTNAFTFLDKILSFASCFKFLIQKLVLKLGACHLQTTSFKRASCVTSETDLNEDYAKIAKK